MDVESNPGPIQTRLTEQRGAAATGSVEKDKKAGSQDQRGRPTEAILQDILSNLEGIDSRLEGVDQRFHRTEERWMEATDKLEVLADKHSELKEENVRLNETFSHLKDKMAYLEGQSSEINSCFVVFKNRGEKPGTNARKQ